MSRATILLVDAAPALRQQLVAVLAAIPKARLESCGSERLATVSGRCQPWMWLLAEPERSVAADGAAVLIPERCARLALDGSAPPAATTLTAFSLPSDAAALAGWVRHWMAVPVGRAPAPLVAESPAMRELLTLIEQLAPTMASVFLSGESGVGKEVLAREIHRRSPRCRQPFIAINCAAIPENMLEATLFGHERGAYTGASEARPGKFQLADGGTLLLDEVTEIPLALQAKLLRVLQEREVEPLGARHPKPVDVRILATSNRLPGAAVAAGVLRADLYYRLNVFPLRIAPLRERREDIVPLAQSMLDEITAGRITTLTPAAQDRLRAHPWPGNVRELRNVMERAAILCRTTALEPAALLFDEDPPGAAGRGTGVENPSPGLDSALRQRESRVILDTLAAAGGNRQQTAQRLGISPRTLRYKLARMRAAGLTIPAER